MRKLDTSFYRHTLLPNLFKAKEEGVDILSKSSLLAHFFDKESEKLWVCCASAKDIEETAEIVNSMHNSRHDIIASLNIKEDMNSKLTNNLLKIIANLRKSGNNELASSLYSKIYARQVKNINDLNNMLWHSDIKIKKPDSATDSYIQELSKKAFDYLKNKTNAEDALIEEAILDFIDQNYLTDPDFKGNIKPTKIFAADFYYKNRGDDLDDLEINSDVSEKEVELAMRELKKYL